MEENEAFTDGIISIMQEQHTSDTYIPGYGNDHLFWAFLSLIYLLMVERSQNAHDDLQA